MNPFDLPSGIADAGIYSRTVAHLRDRGIVLPRFSELANPETIPDATRKLSEAADKNAPDARNLFGVHWFNQSMNVSGKTVPAYIELPSAVTGVPARIVVLLGRHFPMIHAHKVLAAYACLAPRLVTGMFDTTHHRAVWPSTGNYCRGGVAISRILGCHGVAVLPGGMSAERFNWLEQWVTDPSDIVRTPGTESNVKEIYDACAEMAKDEATSSSTSSPNSRTTSRITPSPARPPAGCSRRCASARPRHGSRRSSPAPAQPARSAPAIT